MRPVVIDADTGLPLWRTVDCAAHCEISEATWRSYVNSDRAPQPVAALGKLPLWDAEEVKAWHVGRPGQGNHTRGDQRRGGV